MPKVVDRIPQVGETARIPGTDAVARIASIGVGLDGALTLSTIVSDKAAWNAGLAAYEQAHGGKCRGCDLELER
jgi:hypothetical protein